MPRVPLRYNNIKEEEAEVVKQSHVLSKFANSKKLEEDFGSIIFNNTTNEVSDILTSPIDFKGLTITQPKYESPMMSLEKTINDFCKDKYNILDYLKDDHSDKIMVKYIIDKYYHKDLDIFKDLTLFPRYVRQLIMEKGLKK